MSPTGFNLYQYSEHRVCVLINFTDKAWKILKAKKKR
jgi:uncharacterized protein with GYD domain